MRIALLLILTTAGTLGFAQEFSIDDYQVRWTYLHAGNTQIRVVKTEEDSFISVYKSNGLVSASASLHGDEAVQVGQALARTQEVFEQQQGASDNVSEVVEAGNFNVTFRTSVFNGFTVVIQENTRFSTNAVTLVLDEVLAIQQHLLKANEMLEFLDSKIAF